MNCRAFLVLSLAAFAAGLSATTACSGPDPGFVEFRERPDSGGFGGGGSSGGAGEGGVEGEGGAGEGGAGEGGAPDPIFGTTAYDPATPTGQSAPANSQGGADHNGNVEGKDCVVSGCHGGGSNAPPWAFAGTVYDSTGNATVAKVEVFVTGPDGTVFGKTMTDANGNFWFAKDANDIPANSRVGIRDATTKNAMATLLTGASNGGCSQGMTCHGGAQGKVKLMP